MAKDILFKLNGAEFHFEPVKLDRRKLYGRQEKFALDENGDLCQLAYINEYGTTIIPKGGIGLGILDQKMQWVNRSELKAVYENGEPAQLLPSSFSAAVELGETVSVEEFLNHEITAIYSLQGEENNREFAGKIADGPIYTFSFSYRDDYEGDPAFLIENEGELFLLVGKPVVITFCGLEQAALMEEDSEDIDDDDDLDFSMM